MRCKTSFVNYINIFRSTTKPTEDQHQPVGVLEIQTGDTLQRNLRVEKHPERTCRTFRTASCIILQYSSHHHAALCGMYGGAEQDRLTSVLDPDDLRALEGRFITGTRTAGAADTQTAHLASVPVTATEVPFLLGSVVTTSAQDRLTK